MNDWHEAEWVIDQVSQFIYTLFDPEDIVEIRCLPAHKGPRMWCKARHFLCEPHFDKLMRANDKGCDVYAGVLPRREAGKGSAEDVLAGRVSWADFDGVDVAEVKRRVSVADLEQPTMLINSGHGIHAYWRSQKKVEVCDIVKQCAALAHHLKSDPSVADAARIMRIPGFYNYKPPMALCEIIEAQEITW